MHTIYFATEAIQKSWFDSKVIGTLSFQSQSYSRPTRKSVKVQIKPDAMIGVTYMRFNNAGVDASHPSGINLVDRTYHWYYAFVLACDYVNENTTLVTYEIDVMQTWFIPYGTINPCYVLRNHIARSDDVFSTHLEKEPIGSEVYDMQKISCPNMHSHFSETPYVVVQTTADPLNPPEGYSQSELVKHGLFTGTWYFSQVCNQMGSEDIYNTLYDCLGDWNTGDRKASILSITQFPGHYIHNSDVRYSITHPNSMDSYKPENKKLYAYPYSYLYITSKDGDNGTYRWEYFEGDVTDGSDIEFDLIANEMGGGSLALYPRSYNGIEDNFDAKVTITNFPKCAFAYDGYQAWLASGGQTKTEYDYSVASQRGAIAKEQAGFDLGMGLINESIDLASNLAKTQNTDDAQAIQGGIGAVKNLVNMGQQIGNYYIKKENIDITLDEAQHKRDFTFRDAQYQPNIVVGQQVPNLSMGYGLLEFEFYNVHVRKEEMRKIDDFLTVYGYAINDVMQPNLNIRSHWTFIQTKNCNISGNMPASSKSAIGKIFDGGIFFWRNGDEIGNFESGGRNNYGAILNR